MTMPRILDRYVLREALSPTLISLLVFTFTLEMQPLTTVAERLVERGLDWSLMLRVMAFTLPSALALTIPMSLLCGILVALGRLSGDSEYIAMQASGLGMRVLLRPVMLLAVLFALVSAYLAFSVAPKAATALRLTVFDAMVGAGGDLPPRVFVSALPNVTVFFREPAGGEWQDVFVSADADDGTSVIYLARSGYLTVDRPSETVGLVLRDGTRHVVSGEDPGEHSVTRFDDTVVYYDWQSVFPDVAFGATSAEMTVPELRRALDAAEPGGRRAAEYAVEMHLRFFMPVATLVLALLGVGVAATLSRTGKVGGFLAGVGIIFLCYVMMFTGRAMALSGRVPVWIAMWYPIAVLAAGGAGLLWWRGRGPGGSRQSMRGPDAVEWPSRVIARLALVWQGAAGAIVSRTLDRYVLRTYALVWTVVFLALVALSYSSLITEVLVDVLRSANSPWLVLPFLAYEFPLVVYYVVPVATLLSTLGTFGILTKNSELVVIKACGISVFRTAVAPLAAACVLGVGLFALQERVVPQSTRRAEFIREEIRGRPGAAFRTMNRNWVLGRDGSIYHFDGVDAAAGELRGLSIFELAPGRWELSRYTRVERAVTDVTGGEGIGTWTAWHGTRWQLGSGEPSFEAFDHDALTLEPASYFSDDRPEADRLSYGALSRYIDNLRSGGVNVTPYLVALYRKLSFPLVPVLMTMIALPFAVSSGRRGALHGMGIGAGLAFVYWSAMSIFGALAGAGAVPPLVGAWAPNVLFACGSAYLLLRVRT